MIRLKLAPYLVLIGLTTGVFAGTAYAQDPAGNWLTRLFQPPPAGSVPSSGDAMQWSGQSGASGNPLMTADAIRSAAADFGNCVAGMWPDAARRGIKRENFDRFTAGEAGRSRFTITWQELSNWAILPANAPPAETSGRALRSESAWRKLLTVASTPNR